MTTQKQRQDERKAEQLREAILTYLRGRKVGRRFAGGELPVRLEDLRRALQITTRIEDIRKLDRALQQLRRAKQIRYSSHAGWEIWE